jgi:hypothetical protein
VAPVARPADLTFARLVTERLVLERAGFGLEREEGGLVWYALEGPDGGH